MFLYFFSSFFLIGKILNMSNSLNVKKRNKLCRYIKCTIVMFKYVRHNFQAANTGDIICELYEPSTSKEFRAEASLSLIVLH